MEIAATGAARVAQIVRPAAGGIRNHVRVLVAGIDALGWPAVIYGPSDLDIATRGQRHVHLEIKPAMSPLADLAAVLRLAAHLKRGTELLHAHGLRGAFIGVPAARIARIPSILTAHNMVPALTGAKRVALMRICRSSSRIVAVSEAVARTLESYTGCTDKTTVIPNGIVTTIFHEAGEAQSNGGRRPGPLRIMGIGRLAPEKGFDVLIDAYAKVVRELPGTELIIAGSGPEEARLRRQSSLPIQFLGYAADVPALLRNADVVAVPSRQEGQGIVALEAMAAGKPVVASSVGGIVETVTDGQSGVLAPAGDADALAAALVAVLSSPALAARLGASGRDRVEQEFTASRMVARTLTLYRQVLEEAAHS